MEASEIAERMTAFLTKNEETLLAVAAKYPGEAEPVLDDIAFTLEELNAKWEDNMTNFIRKYNSQTNLKENDLYAEIDVITEVLSSYLETIYGYIESIRSIVGDDVAAEIKQDSELFFGNYLNEMNEYVRNKTQVGGRRGRSRKNRSRKNRRQNRRTQRRQRQQKQRGGYMGSSPNGACKCSGPGWSTACCKK
jgi:hypothetical protein